MLLGTYGEEVEEVEEEDAYGEDYQEGCDNMTQLRQSGTSGQDKFGISIEMVQFTFGVFDKFSFSVPNKTQQCNTTIECYCRSGNLGQHQTNLHLFLLHFDFFKILGPDPFLHPPFLHPSLPSFIPVPPES